MSKCISPRGEYSEHTPDEDYICAACLGLDEDAIIEELHQLRAQVASAKAQIVRMMTVVDEAEARQAASLSRTFGGGRVSAMVSAPQIRAALNGA